MVEYVARWGRSRGSSLRVAILGRGYGQGRKGSTTRSRVLGQNLPDVPHLPGGDRSLAGGDRGRDAERRAARPRRRLPAPPAGTTSTSSCANSSTRSGWAACFRVLCSAGEAGRPRQGRRGRSIACDPSPAPGVARSGRRPKAGGSGSRGPWPGMRPWGFWAKELPRSRSSYSAIGRSRRSAGLAIRRGFGGRWTAWAAGSSRFRAFHGSSYLPRRRDMAGPAHVGSATSAR